jgi:hypothetical protein
VPITTTPSLVVLAFAVGLALVTGIVFGAAPAWFATRTDPIDALRGSGRSTSDHSSRARTALLMVQATLSVVLVAGSTMLARSLDNLQHQDFGYRVRGRVAVGLNRLPATYTMQPCRLQKRPDEVDRAAVPFHPRAHPGHRLPARRSRAAAQEDAGGSRSEPDDHERQNDAAANRPLI